MVTHDNCISLEMIQDKSYWTVIHFHPILNITDSSVWMIHDNKSTIICAENIW